MPHNARHKGEQITHSLCFLLSSSSFATFFLLLSFNPPFILPSTYFFYFFCFYSLFRTSHFLLLFYLFLLLFIRILLPLNLFLSFLWTFGSKRPRFKNALATFIFRVKSVFLTAVILLETRFHLCSLYFAPDLPSASQFLLLL